MIYSLLRGIAGVALRWYYADVTIASDQFDRGANTRDPFTGPLLVVVNHPNALVDVLVAARAVPRRLLFTAKATLFTNPVARALLTVVGVVPLRRQSDEASGTADPARNARTFDAVSRALGSGGAVLVFPEGKSHDEPALAPLRTGVARIALQSRESGSVHGLRILPIGLVFQRKDAPRTRVLAIVGEPLDVDSWTARIPGNAVAELTGELDARLRAITLNYSSSEAAVSDFRMALQIAALIRYDAPPISTAGDLRDQANVARLMPAVRTAVERGPPELATRVARFQSDLGSLQASLNSHHISLDDLAISRGVREGANFVAREMLVVLTAGPVALWGWVNHILPFRAAIAVGRRSRATANDPAMRTIVAGAAFVLMVYMLQGAAVALLAGPWWALVYVASLPIAADVNLTFQDRLRRAVRRARTYLLFRARPEVQEGLERTARALRVEALALAGAAGVRSAD